MLFQGMDYIDTERPIEYFPPFVCPAIYMNFATFLTNFPGKSEAHTFFGLFPLQFPFSRGREIIAIIACKSLKILSNLCCLNLIEFRPLVIMVERT